MRPPTPPVISYATPRDSRARPVAAVCTGLLAVIVGVAEAAWTALGIASAVAGFLDGAMREEPMSYVALVSISLTLGFICLYAAMRFRRAARRFIDR